MQHTITHPDQAPALRPAQPIEIHYLTAGGASRVARFSADQEEDLERKLIALCRRRQQATVTNTQTGQLAGGVEAAQASIPWHWWYSPARLDAREVPSSSMKVVTSLAPAQWPGIPTKNTETSVSAK
jgi:hypothetical protein